MKKEHSHNCKFMRRCKTLDSMYPPNQKFSVFRRKFQEFFLVSEKNGRKCHSPQGNAGYIFQKEIQLTQNVHVIHPYSEFCHVWECIALIEFYIGLLLRCFFVAHLPINSKMVAYGLLSDLFETADVFLRFNIGYLDKGTQDIVLQRRKIFFYTIKKVSFYVDVIVSFPFEFLLTLSSYYIRIRHFVVYIKILKIFTMTRYLRHIAKVYNWSDFCFCVVWILWYTFLLSNWVSTFVYGVIHLSDINAKNIGTDAVEGDKRIPTCIFRHMKYLHVITCILFGNDTLGEDVFISGLNFPGLFCFVVLLLNLTSMMCSALIIQVIGIIRNAQVVFHEVVQETQNYLAQENVPKHVHRKVKKYLKSRYPRGGYFEEERILETLSRPLRREITNFICLKLLKDPGSIFKALSDEIASDLCMLLKYEVFLPGDIIQKQWKMSNKVFFIYSGSVAVYTERNEILHFYEGQLFGAATLSKTPINLFTVIALEMTECYVMLFRDFKAVLAEAPEQAALVTKAAQERVDYLFRLFKESQFY